METIELNKATGQTEFMTPKEPLRGKMQSISLSSIPEEQTAASSLPASSFVETVQIYGVLTPILIAPLTENDSKRFAAGGDCRYKLLAGRRRVLAARIVGHLLINAVIFPYGTTPYEAVCLIENEQRSENPLIKLQEIEALIKKGATIDDICIAVGMDRRRAEKCMRLANLIPELRGLLIENKIAVGVAQDAARLTAEEQTRLFNNSKGTSGKIRGIDVTNARRVKAADTAAGLPSSIFGKPAPDQDEEDRPVFHATAPVSSGFMVALNNSQEPATERKPFPSLPFSINSGQEAEDAARALIQWFDRPDAPVPSVPETALMYALEEYVKGDRPAQFARQVEANRAEIVSDPTPTPQETQGDPEGPIGVKGQTIKPESQKRQERRERQRQAARSLEAEAAGNNSPVIAGTDEE